MKDVKKVSESYNPCLRSVSNRARTRVRQVQSWHPGASASLNGAPQVPDLPHPSPSPAVWFLWGRQEGVRAQGLQWGHRQVTSFLWASVGQSVRQESLTISPWWSLWLYRSKGLRKTCAAPDSGVLISWTVGWEVEGAWPAVGLGLHAADYFQRRSEPQYKDHEDKVENNTCQSFHHKPF